jgi:hypothetical protein
MFIMEKNPKKVRIYLTIEPNLHQKLKTMANKDYMKVATWTTRFLMQELCSTNKPNCLTSDVHASL